MKIAKLKQIPIVIPRGLFFPPVVAEERIIGRSGQMHGARIVTSPEMNAKIRRMITFSF